MTGPDREDAATADRTATADTDRTGAVDVVARTRAAVDVTALSSQPGTRATSSGARPEHVWYVSYGSNLLRERFERYLLGGRLPGLDVLYPGGEGCGPASDDRAVVLPGRLVTALDAPAWGGGGVAFWLPPRPDLPQRSVDASARSPGADGPGVLARAWRVRLSQYLEVVHLENGGRDRREAPWPEQVLSAGEAAVGTSWYSRLVRPGWVDGEPALTFTHPRPDDLVPVPASPAYADVVCRGVVETFGALHRGGLDADDAAAYLARAGAAPRPPEAGR